MLKTSVSLESRFDAQLEADPNKRIARIDLVHLERQQQLSTSLLCFVLAI